MHNFHSNHHLFLNFSEIRSTSDTKPNINDLRQLFDDPHQLRRAFYFDPKSSGSQEPTFFDTKTNTNSKKNRIFDFEQTKQKFDNLLHSSQNPYASNKIPVRITNQSKLKSDTNQIRINQNSDTNDTKQIVNDQSVKDDGIQMKLSLNLDSLKVSEDEDVSSISNLFRLILS